MSDMDNRVIGQCHSCGHPIISGEGITVDPDNNRWHPECRVVARRQQTAAPQTSEPAEVAPKRRGRPPKVAAVPDA